MAVELRCPECRAKLRLHDAPEEGTEVECPKCGHAFPAPETDDAAKKLPDDMKKPAAAEPKKGVALKAAPKKRKAIVHKSNPKVLIGIVIGGLFVLAAIVSALVWFMGRKSVAVELLGYLPDDADGAVGVNIGHVQKYPEVFKIVEPTYANSEFKKAADAIGAACGIEGRDWLTYAVSGRSKGGGSTVAMRSKAEFDPSALSKLPGAREASGDGGKYYTATIDGMGSVRAFAPTNRIVVFCSAGVSQAAFGKMMGGNKDNPKAFTERMGVLGKRMSKGTLWSIQLYDAPPPKNEAAEGTANDQGQASFAKLQNELFGGAQGMGFKASLGSRAVRFEVALTRSDKEAASALAKKYNDSVWTKGDDEEPPREWKFMKQQFGDQKVAREIYSNIGFTSSGNVFAVYTECDTKILMQQMGGLLNKVTGNQQQNFGGGGVPPGGGPPPGMTPGGQRP